MSTNPRDTQFLGFAELLFDNLPWNDINIDMEFPGWEDRWKTNIAQRSYDLVQHTLNMVTFIQFACENAQNIQDIIGLVPDMEEKEQ